MLTSNQNSQTGPSSLCDLLEGPTLLLFTQVSERGCESEELSEEGNFLFSLRRVCVFVGVTFERKSWDESRRGWRERKEERCSRKGVGGRKNIADIPDNLCRVQEGRRSLIFRLSVSDFTGRPQNPFGERRWCDLLFECDREDSQWEFVICLWQIFSSTKIIQMWEIRHSWKVIIPDICI